MNDHADVLDNRDVTEELLRRRIEAQALKIANVKAIISKSDADSNHVIEMNDANVKEVMETSFKAVLDFLAQNNGGIKQFFLEADASFAKLKKSIEDAKVDEANRPSNVAAGPKGVAFMGLRADFRKLEEKMEATAAAVNVATMSAGAAPSRGADSYAMPSRGADSSALTEL